LVVNADLSRLNDPNIRILLSIRIDFACNLLYDFFVNLDMLPYFSKFIHSLYASSSHIKSKITPLLLALVISPIISLSSYL